MAAKKNRVDDLLKKKKRKRKRKRKKEVLSFDGRKKLIIIFDR